MEQLAPSEVTVANGSGWRLARIRCTAGAGRCHAEERHDRHVIAIVQAGMFSYHGAQGRTLLHAGSLLLGNSGCCYSCGHEHGEGDQCLALQMDDEFFADLAGEMTGRLAYTFPKSRAAIRPEWLRHLVLLPGEVSSTELEENVAIFAGDVIAGVAQADAGRPATLGEELRIARALRLMERHRTTHLDLAQLACCAHMSKFHFLRLFKRMTGTTPYQHILRLRLVDVAQRLIAGSEPVTAVALACGFGDISTFNRTFRNVYGTSPTAFRRKAA